MKRTNIALIAFASMFLVSTLTGTADAGPKERAAVRTAKRSEAQGAHQLRAQHRAQNMAAMGETPLPAGRRDRWEDRVDRREDHRDQREDIRDRREDRRDRREDVRDRREDYRDRMDGYTGPGDLREDRRDRREDLRDRAEDRWDRYEDIRDRREDRRDRREDRRDGLLGPGPVPAPIMTIEGE